MSPDKMQARANMAQSMIKKLNLRGMEGQYVNTKEEALSLIKKMLQPGDSVGWGGSATLDEIGFYEYIHQSDCDVIDRTTAKTKEEEKVIKARTINADYFFMSSNAITQDGILVNIDAYGNRVSSLTFGPEHVVVIAGMNKVAPDVESAVSRVRNIASPANTVRLKKDTPCAKLGHCANCLSDDCICCSVVITRKDDNHRIKVILVGEDLGF